MIATHNEIRLAADQHGRATATLHREVDGEWELWLFVDDPDDLAVVKLSAEGQARAAQLHAYLFAEDGRRDLPYIPALDVDQDFPA